MSSRASSASAGGDQPSKAPSTSPSDSRSIAFLVHSPNSIANNLAPDCDNKPLARQRRRRTSPEDQKILEQAFSRNPRPSKDERKGIIDKVALGDKEVQIWFQNRRQNSRRKAKPLSPHELEAHLLSRQGSSTAVSQGTPSSPSTETEAESNTELVVDPAQASFAKEQDVPDDPRVDLAEIIPDRVATRIASTVDAIKRPDNPEDSQSTVITSENSSQAPPDSTLLSERGSSQVAPSSQDAFVTCPTYLANRRSAQFARQHSQDTPTILSEQPTETALIPGLKKSGSYLRLSTTEDGLARIIDRAAPSPPRSQDVIPTVDSERAQVGLRRSYSAAGLNDMVKVSQFDQHSRKAPRVSQAGRSRDSRAWEFWCDSEARNLLVQTAEQENSGSAADAIGLIRQTSRSALRPLSRNANSPVVSQGSWAASIKQTRPALRRSSTTHGRLQQPKSATRKGSANEEEPEFDPESDKENLDPEGSVPYLPRRRQHGGASNLRRNRPVLGDNTTLPSYANSIGGHLDSEKKGRAGLPAAIDSEVAAFMGGAGESDDFDCVQSLLNLSKGNWR